MRAPFQVLAIPYRKGTPVQFCVLRRSDHDQWQFVAGGGEDDEKPIEAAIREILEEAGIEAKDHITLLRSMAYVPADVISERHRKHWPKDTYVIPEYHFAFECVSDIKLSDEHLTCDWLSYDEAMARLTWDSNKTALYELSCRLSAEE